MPWKEPWYLKARRRLGGLRSRIAPRRRYFVSTYLGADFLLRPGSISGLEISTGIGERPELQELIKQCVSFRPNLFIDIGANIGLYSCILLKRGAVPRAMLFEPDRTNLVHLRANLLINQLLDRAEIHELALGDEPGFYPFMPGATDGGFSRVLEPGGAGTYEVKVRRLDDLLKAQGQRIAVKMDVERYERKVLTGMQSLLSDNACLVQIEAFEEAREDVIAMMAALKYSVAHNFAPNFIFKKDR